jgi:hypothetical protein
MFGGLRYFFLNLFLDQWDMFPVSLFRLADKKSEIGLAPLGTNSSPTLTKSARKTRRVSAATWLDGERERRVA